MIEKYFIILYYSVLNIGNNELGPVNIIELGIATILLTFSSIMNA